MEIEEYIDSDYTFQEFEIDLIVWKWTDHERLVNSSHKFEIDLIVWK